MNPLFVAYGAGHAVAHEAWNVEDAVEREARHIGSQVEHVAHRIEHAAANEVHKVEHRVSEGVHVLRQEAIHAYQKTKHAVDHDVAAVEHEARRIGHAVEHVTKTVAEHPGAVAMASLEVVGGAAETIGGAALGLVTSETVVGAVIGATAVVDGASKTGAGIADLASVLNGKIDQVGTHNVLQNIAKQYGGTTGEVVYDTASLGLGFVGGGVSDAKQVAEVVASHGKAAVSVVKAGTKQLQDLTSLGNRWSPSLAFASDGGRVSRVADRIEETGKDAHVMQASVRNEGQVTEQTSALVKASGSTIGISTQSTTAIDERVNIIQRQDLPGWLQRTFTDGNYKTGVTNQDVTLYRTFGGKADAGGAFATTSRASSRIQAKIDTAQLPEWGGSRMYEATIVVPKGTTLNIGKVESQIVSSTGTILKGGADQVLLPPNWPLEWIKDVRIVPSK